VTLHTTGDPLVPYRHELIYFNRAALLGTDDQLTVLPVERAGHCAFKAQEVVGGLAALLLNADSDLVLALTDPLEALHGVVDTDIGTGRLAERVQNQASAFLDRLENEFGFLKEARHVATDGVDAVTDLAGNAGDITEDGLDGVTDLGGNAAGAAQNGLDTVTDLGGNAVGAAQDAIDPVQDLGDEEGQDRGSVLRWRLSTYTPMASVSAPIARIGRCRGQGPPAATADAAISARKGDVS
jgi:hypothetical protein